MTAEERHEYYIAHRDERLKWQHDYYIAHRDEILRKHREYRNRDKLEIGRAAFRRGARAWGIDADALLSMIADNYAALRSRKGGESD